MTRQEARLVLAGYRPNGADASDPRLAEALALARHDPELAAWFLRQQEFDSAVADRLGAVTPPPLLRDEIFVSARFHPRRIDPRLRLAAVALVLLGFTAGLVSWRVSSIATAAEADLVMFAANYAFNGITLQKESDDTRALRNWLAAQHAPLPSEWPTALVSLRGLGCRTLSFKGRAVSLICFGQDHEFHLFVARRADFPELRMTATPRAHSGAGGWSSAAWADADFCFVLVSDAPPSELQRYLPKPRTLGATAPHRPDSAPTMTPTLWRYIDSKVVASLPAGPRPSA